VAKVVTVHAPPIQPVNLQAVPQAGGTLAADTIYYWRVWAVGNAAAGSGSNYIHGEISTEGTFTTTSTNRSAALSWDACSGALGYGVVLRKSTDSADYTGSKFIRGDGSSYYVSTYTNALTVDGSEALYYQYHQFTTYDFPGGLDKTLGAVAVEISGGTAGDPITPEDITAAIADESISACDPTAWYLRGFIFASDDQETHFHAEDKFIFVTQFIYWDTGGYGSTWTFGVDSTSDPNPCAIQVVGMSFHRPVMSNGNCTHYSTCYLGEGVYYQYPDYGPCNTYNMVANTDGITLHNVSWFEQISLRGNIDFNNVFLPEGLVIQNYAVDFESVRRIRTSYLDLLTVSGATLYEIEVDADGGTTMRRGNANSAPVTIVELTVPDADPGYENLPRVYWYGNNPGESEEEKAKDAIWLKEFFDLVVTNAAGVPLVGVNVVIKNVDGIEVTNEITDSYGKIPQQNLVRCVVTRNDYDTGNWYRIGYDYTDFTFHTPHTLTIDAGDEYDTYESKLTVSGPLDLHIAMGPAGMIQAQGIIGIIEGDVEATV
jgi:hypothetical protein